MKKSIVWIIFFVLVGIGAVSVIANYSHARAQVVIGAVLPLTGAGAYWGEPVQKGIKLAVSDIRAAYGSNAIAVVYEDDKSTSKDAASAASKLINIDKVDGLYSEFSGPSAAVSPIALDAHKPLIYSAFNQKIVESNALSVKSFMSFEQTCAQYAVYTKAHGAKKIAIINQLVDAAPYCMRALEKEYPSTDVVLYDNVTGVDFRTILLKMKKEKVDTIVPLMYEAGAMALIQQTNDLGMHVNLFCDKQDCATDKILHSFSSAQLSGLVYFDAAVSQAFRDRYANTYGSSAVDETEPAAFAYEVTWAYFLAMRECKNDASCAVEKFNDLTLESRALEHVSFKDRVLAAQINYTLMTDAGTKSLLLK